MQPSPRPFGRLAAVVAVAACAVVATATSPDVGSAGAVAGRTFEIVDDTFLKDGEPFQVKAGCIHYSRVPAEYWEDRLLRLRAMGLNAVQTYVPWNWHEEVQGAFDFGGTASARADRNLTHFLTLARELDMVVVLRAGPYMCGEWEFGGLPAWLFENGSIPIRTMAHPYVDFATRFWKEGLFPLVEPMLFANGGPVVMVQVENEYGSYGNVGSNPADAQYMHLLIDTAREALGNDTLLFTTDGGDTGYMSRGSFKGDSIYTVGDGCGNPQTCIAAQKAFNAPGKSPFFCSECYTGWLTHWGEGGANTSSSAPHVDAILALNGSVSLYMGHGGTNFGFTAGANGGGGSSFQPHETSYDYNSPVSEGGEHGFHQGQDKFAMLHAVFSKYASTPPPVEPPLPTRKAYGTLAMQEYAPLLSNIKILSPTPASVGAASPPFAESVGCYYGFVVYSTLLPASAAGATAITLNGVRDRAQVFIDGVQVGTVYRVDTPDAATLTIPAGLAKAGSRLKVVVEIMARINFSHGMDKEIKGITGGVSMGAAAVGNWTTHCVPLNDPAQLRALPWQPVSTAGAFAQTGPTFFRGELAAAAASADTFLKLDGWTKGVAWVNDFNLGRYWPVEGPQQTLFVPGPKLALAGANSAAATFTILELDNASASVAVELQEQPELQTPPPSKTCDPTSKPVAGSKVAMYSQAAKLAHQQAWAYDNATGHFALKADPTLCLAVEAGCPHASSGCVQLAACDGATASATQTFVFVEDKTEPGAHTLHVGTSNDCLDIFSHGATDGAALEVYPCYGPGEDNERFELDLELGLLRTRQAGPTPGAAFVVSACGGPAY